MDDIVFDEIDIASEDSIFDLVNPLDPGLLKVYQTGDVTVVGFGGQDIPSDICIAIYRRQLCELIDDNDCRVLGIDLAGVTLVPSGMLGLMTSLRKKVERIELYNPSRDILEVLQISRVEHLFEIKFVSWDE